MSRMLDQLSNELKLAQLRLDWEAGRRLSAMQSSIGAIKANVEWLSANAERVARPPHSQLSDLSDEGLPRFANQLQDRARALFKVGESMKSDLLKMYGEPEAIRRIRLNKA